MSAVLDASFLAAALVPSQVVEAAANRWKQLVLQRTQTIAPNLLQAEFVSTVRRLERRRVLADREVAGALSSFALAPIEFAWEPAWVDRALEIARDMNLSTIYDAIYLACAETYDADLFTCDRQFCAAFGDPLPARVKLVSIAP